MVQPDHSAKMRRSQVSDPRLLGALLALTLDIALLATSVVLVAASVSEASALLLASAVGLAVFPALGWRYGRRAVRRPGEPWAGDALRTLLLVDVAFVAAYVLVQAVLVPVQDGLIDRLLFVAYATLIDTVAVVALTLLVAVPMGVVWTRLMRRAIG